MTIKRSCRSLPLLLVGFTLGCGSTTAARPAAVSDPTAPPATAPAPVATAPPTPEAAPPWTAVENPQARYIVALGMPTAHDDTVRGDHLERARLHAARILVAMDGLELAPAHFDRAALGAESTRRDLLGVFFECGITLHDVDSRGTHFAVNVAVVDLRTEDIVASLTGRATAPGPTSDENEQLALEGALNTALRGVPVLLASLDRTSPKATD